MDKQEKKPKQDNQENPPNISRRDFLKGMGTSAIATSITIPSAALAAAADAGVPPALGEAWIQLNYKDFPGTARLLMSEGRTASL